MVPLFLYTVDGVMIDCLVMSWPWSLSSIMRLFTSLVSWGLVYFQRRAYMHVCSFKNRTTSAAWFLIFSLLSNAWLSALSVTDPTTKDLSKDDGKALIQPHSGNAISCRLLYCPFLVGSLQSMLGFVQKLKNSDCVLLPYHGFRGCFHFNCKTGECLSLVLGCDHICSLVSLPPWICILISCQKRNAEISSGVLGALCTF